MVIYTYCSNKRWTDVQFASLTTDCVEQQQCQLQFGMAKPGFTPLGMNQQSTISGREISTVPLDPNPPSPFTVLVQVFATPTDAENEVLDRISSDRRLSEILTLV